MLQIKTIQPNVFPDLIERIWILENLEEATSIAIPPNQYINLIIPIDSSKFSINQVEFSKAIIEGMSLQNTYAQYPKGCKLLGIRFYPYGMYPFLNINGKEWINKRVGFSLFMDESNLNSLNIINLNDHALIKKVEGFLLNMYDEKSFKKITILKNYYKRYRREEKALSIEAFCQENDTNYTSLNRLFSQVIGISPKKFERLIKFRKSLCKLIDTPESLTNIGLDSGYFDQAHFIREFKLFLNNTPSQYQNLIKQADKESKIINYNFRLL